MFSMPSSRDCASAIGKWEKDENSDGQVEVTKNWAEKEIHRSRRRVGSKHVVSHDFNSKDVNEGVKAEGHRVNRSPKEICFAQVGCEVDLVSPQTAE